MCRLLKTVVVLLALSAPALSLAQGKVAVVDVQGAILMTDEAQKRMQKVRDQKDYKSDKAEYERLKSEGEALLKKFQKDAAVMSKDQQVAAQKKLSTKQADIDHVTRKLRQAEETTAQEIFQEMTPRVQKVLRDLIEAEGIGLLLHRTAAIHVDASYSITAKVTEKLNQGAGK